MTFFLDENFPKSASVLLEGMGHRVLDLRGTGREGASDQAIFAEDQLAGAVFLTNGPRFLPHGPASAPLTCGRHRHRFAPADPHLHSR